eukprot:gnl/MRDRNA2_/MRDRNA2_70817_c0_seq1.p1 gnl/MRDRNA2_/MRDRNA2_70817_c0~~gnl/MRDRNA2_/MRDRNA2_70817_c0_seq1.p1  ORF type:complete len:492 (-),score=75.77 gnl/MRDRNA2_/MRDRNA2_70817_c0_seq1:110-1585(-)
MGDLTKYSPLREDEPNVVRSSNFTPRSHGVRDLGPSPRTAYQSNAGEESGRMSLMLTPRLHADQDTGCCSSWLPDVNNEKFDLCIGLVIVGNACVIGLETDLPDCLAFDASEHFFNGIFFAEMLLRLRAMRLAYFQVAWNVFDFTLVCTGTLDLWIMPVITGGHEGGGIASLMRLLRVLRILRVIRIFRMFRELALIVKSFANAVSSVCWIGLLVLIVDYICAVFLTRTIGHNADAWNDDQAILIKYWFGSIGKSMYTLFLIMTLAGWDQICSIIMEEYPFSVIFFMLYILVASYTMVSLITGVISESLISAEKEDEINKIKAIEAGRRELTSSLQQVFESMDADNSGSLSKGEILDVIKNDARVSAKLESLEISVSTEELIELFNTLLKTQRSSNEKIGPDGDPIKIEEDSDTIPIEKFVKALSAIRGQASSKEIFSLRQEVQAIAHRQGEVLHIIQGHHAEEIRKLQAKQVEVHEAMKELLASVKKPSA